MISDAAGIQRLEVVWYLLATASAGVFLHAGIKFPWFVFFQKDSGLRPAEPPWNMRAAMVHMMGDALGSVAAIGAARLLYRAIGREVRARGDQGVDLGGREVLQQ